MEVSGEAPRAESEVEAAESAGEMGLPARLVGWSFEGIGSMAMATNVEM